MSTGLRDAGLPALMRQANKRSSEEHNRKDRKMAKKITPGTGSKGDKGKGDKKKRDKKKRAQFDLSTAVIGEGDDAEPIELEDGKLTAIPTNFDFAKFKPLGKNDFKDGALFFDYCYSTTQLRIANLTKKAESYKTKAANARKYRDKTALKRANRIESLKATLEKLQEEERKADEAAAEATATS